MVIAKAFAQAGIRTFVGHTKPADITDAMLTEACTYDIGFFYPTDLTTEDQLQAIYDAGYTDIYTLPNTAWVCVADFFYKRR